MTFFLSKITTQKLFYEIIPFNYKTRSNSEHKLHSLNLYKVERKSLFSCAIRTSQSFSQVTESWATDIEVCGGVGGRPQSNIQQTLSCKVPETRPGPAAIPTAASSLETSPERAENPTSLTIGSMRDVRRETNLGTPLRYTLLATYLVPDLYFRYLNVIVREKR